MVYILHSAAEVRRFDDNRNKAAATRIMARERHVAINHTETRSSDAAGPKIVRPSSRRAGQSPTACFIGLHNSGRRNAHGTVGATTSGSHASKVGILKLSEGVSSMSLADRGICCALGRYAELLRTTAPLVRASSRKERYGEVGRGETVEPHRHGIGMRL